jgi:hypothetical protein
MSVIRVTLRILSRIPVEIVADLIATISPSKTSLTSSSSSLQEIVEKARAAERHMVASLRNIICIKIKKVSGYEFMAPGLDAII